MHDSFLRSVTSDLYISGSYWPCARVSSHSLWSRDATQPTRCDATCFVTRQPTPVHTYAMHLTTVLPTTVCCAPRRRKGTCRVCNVAGRSQDCRPKPSSCSVRTPRPSFFMVDSWSSPRLLLFQSHLLESAGTFAGEGPFRCLRRSDSPLDCASRSRCA